VTALNGAAVLAVGVATALVYASPVRSQPSRDLTAAAFAALLPSDAAQRPGLRVEGDVDLQRVKRGGLVCHDCVFTGAVNARDARFGGPVDLSGSTVDGELDLSDATFARGLQARNATFDGIVDLRNSVVTGATDLTGATFRGPALFGEPPDPSRSSFGGASNFTLTTFEQLATFEDATFGGATTFTLARFERDGVFAGCTSAHDATFTRVTFSGPSDFDNFTFERGADFTAAAFDGPSDFGQAKFYGPATFDDSRFGTEASFVGASFFRKVSAGEADSFQSLNATQGLDFALAEFDRGTLFNYASSAPVTSFARATFGPHASFIVSNASFVGLDMSVAAIVRYVLDNNERDREHMLNVLESSATARGDLGAANNAHYARQVLRSEHHGWFVHDADYTVYRLGAGYFVRPWNPLAVLALIMGICSLVRAVRREDWSAAEVTGPSATAAVRLRRAGGPAAQSLWHWPGELLTTFEAMWWNPQLKPGQRKISRLEALVYRVLFACALVGFAKSNPTLREMFDALR